MSARPENIRPSEDGRGVVILDQTLLPGETRYLELTTAEQMYEAIRMLRVRGAPAIGIFAAYAMAALAKTIRAQDPADFLTGFRQLAAYLNSARPTAVNLSAQLKRMEQTARENVALSRERLLERLDREALAIQNEDIAMCRRIAEYGLSLLKPGDGLLTHCNAGPLATSLYGTALGPMLLGQEQGYGFHVYCDETRPLLQGARLTSWELSRAGVDCTLICDNMASIVMKEGRVQACLVGCDRVARNGDTANKIGTSGVAVLAQYYGIPFDVLGPVTTLDPDCPTGADIVIEQREPEEIRSLFYRTPMAPAEVRCFNPAFDVTDHSLITAIVTDRGILYPPYEESIKEILR